MPVILTRKLDRLPQTIPWEAGQKLLSMPDRTTLIGNRNYAILRPVASYRLRIGQAIHLRVRDIDWCQGLFHFLGGEGLQCSLLPRPGGSRRVESYCRRAGIQASRRPAFDLWFELRFRKITQQPEIEA